MQTQAVALLKKVDAAASLPTMLQARTAPGLIREYARLLVEITAEMEALKVKVAHIADIIAQAP